MKLSARNQLKDKIVEATKGVTTSRVCVDIGHDVIITSSITNDAVDLKGGDSMDSHKGTRLNTRKIEIKL